MAALPTRPKYAIVTLHLHPAVYQRLEELLDTGLHGRSVHDVAERLLCDIIRERYPPPRPPRPPTAPPSLFDGVDFQARPVKRARKPSRGSASRPRSPSSPRGRRRRAARRS